MAEKNVCPHCGAIMDPIETPMDSSWGGEIHHVCFNDECRYFVQSWDVLEAQGIEDAGYRCSVDPRGNCQPLAVWSRDALKDLVVCEAPAPELEATLKEPPGTLDFFDAKDFARADESPDATFYQDFKTTGSLDSLALATIRDLYERLIPKGSRILDLMAASESHIGDGVQPVSIIGLGLNGEELQSNKALTETILHDLNADSSLPFYDNQFDAVVNTVSVEYLTRPVEVFREVARVLRPDGLFIVVFSNRMFPPKAVNIWKEADEDKRVELVRNYIARVDTMFLDGSFESKGKPRPEDDQLYSLGIPSDPVYAVWARVRK